MRTDFRLCRAARFGDLDRVKSLVAAEPELVDVKDDEGFLPLHWAARFDHREIAEFLLTNGAEVDGRESHEMTPLHIAASSSSEDVAALLIEHGADVNARDNNGDTPLDFAAFANYSREGIAATLPPMFHLLREKGAEHGNNGIKQARVVDVIEEIEHGRSAGAESVKHVPRSAASFCVTLVGTTPAESDDLEDALHSTGGSLAFEIRREPSAASSSFPAEAIHAIVFTPTSLAQAMPADVDAVRAATKPGTCRVYLLVSPGASSPSGASRLDDFIQRTPTPSSDAIAEQIVGFFREADHLNRRSTLLALRDLTCLGAYKFLKVLWPLSYIFAVLHVLNATATVAGRAPWPGMLANPYVVPAAIFFGAFFVVHCIFVIVRNALFGMRIVKRINLEFALGMGAFGLAAVATARSIAALDESTLRILASAVLAMGAYLFYMYVRRIRAECSSLSQLQAVMADTPRRMEILKTVGRKPLTSGAFPFLPFRSKSLFISYMHGSKWSSETAAMIHRWTAEHGFEVFLDQSSIPPGSLWRQFLLRAISEYGWFVAVLDSETEATKWVLAESAYAALLRKSIGKPRILVVVRKTKGLAKLEQGPFGALYMDLFQLPPELCVGAGMLIVDHDELSAGLILRAMDQVRPMCLLR